MTTAGEREYQFVIFGASGFTGQFVVEEVSRAADGDEFRGPGLRWAVAGRNKEKLEEVLQRAADRLAKPQLKTEIGIIICDVNDPPSLAEMCKKASVVLDCVGPYRFFGEPVVKACVENGAHFIDISGEPQFLEGMYFKYDSQAAEKGVYVVGSSGFDSIPADLGVLFTRNSLKGTLTAVESFLSFKSGPEGTCIHDGTWQSAIHGVADQGNLRKLRKQFPLKPVPIVGAKLKRRGAVFYSNELKEYAIPFLGADVAVVKRTQRFLHENYQETPVQYSAYVAVGGIASVIKLIFVGILFLLFTQFNCGRQLLIKYPKFFSFGFFSKEGPTQKQMDDASFTMTFFGQGYSEGQDPQQGKPSVKICTQVSGPEVAYVATPIAMVQAGVTIIKEPKSLPKRGGVFTPGAAFSKTKIIERLNKAGLQFNVIAKPEA
ncbi:saccharopine dehydrogenase-like oxidoreductase isoform X2 [Bombina bombina]|uniref:saccharopine dehydrogenase-like oxidoreductase isoform X2 n=1 Tax=Bombina bombina TaxID=8345 RepID=UPI00235A7515|nr:saccharopine dehydrogenase-like oxidoreductase isoform X2 [Bombina bombina]